MHAHSGCGRGSDGSFAAGRRARLSYVRWRRQDARKLCSSLRRNSRDERILFHYNGHGVPRPTPNGEIWVFNKNFTQYIPLSVYDLQTWMGSPSIFVYDCSGAGHILNAFNMYAEQREREYEKALVRRDPIAHGRPRCRRANIWLSWSATPPPFLHALPKGLGPAGHGGPEHGCPADARLHSASRMRRERDPADEPEPAGGPVHVVPDHADRDCDPLLYPAKPAHDVAVLGRRRQDPRCGQGSSQQGGFGAPARPNSGQASYRLWVAATLQDG